MGQYDKYPQWAQDAKLCLNWFKDTLGAETWEKRRQGVVKYFNSSNSFYPTKGRAPEYKPIAVYNDWIGWYMYLVECLADRPACDEPMQSARIYPFFAAIGRHLNLLKEVRGIQDRLIELLNASQNQPDSTLFELVVAACYCRNGWKVQFLKEAPPEKTPDFSAEREGLKIFVECKRFAKITDYAERERQEWIKRWKILLNSIDKNYPPTHFQIVFKLPIEQTNPEILKNLFLSLDGHPKSDTPTIIEADEVSMLAKKIDIQAVDAHFNEYDVRCGSPQMVALLTGSFSPFSNYTQKVVPTSINFHGEDDGLHTCNWFFGGIHTAYSAEWKCVAAEAVNAKAKDVKKMLSKAVAQFPSDTPCVVHIGYETLSGPIVEFKRHDKTIETISNFDYGDKDVQLIFLNALQCVSSAVERFECAETTLMFRRQGGLDPDVLLPSMLLLDQDSTEAEDTTHWQQDYDQGNS